MLQTTAKLSNWVKRKRYVVVSMIEELDYVAQDARLIIDGIDTELSRLSVVEKTFSKRIEFLGKYFRGEEEESWSSAGDINLKRIDDFFENYGSLDNDRIKVVFQIHGYAQTPYVWSQMNERIEHGNELDLYDKKVLALSLGYYFHKKIDSNVRSIAKQIRHYMSIINRRHGRHLYSFAAVGHSKGGIVLNVYMKNRIFEKVAPAKEPYHVTHVVCIASPHNGTYFAYLEDVFRYHLRLLGINLTGGRELKPYSEFMKRIHSMDLPGLSENEPKTDYTIIRAGILDPLVFNRFTHPHSVGKLEDMLYKIPFMSLLLNSREGATESRLINYSSHHAIPQVKRRVLDAFGHTYALFSDQGIHCTLENLGVIRIKRRDAQAIKDVPHCSACSGGCSKTG